MSLADFPKLAAAVERIKHDAAIPPSPRRPFGHFYSCPCEPCRAYHDHEPEDRLEDVGDAPKTAAAAELLGEMLAWHEKRAGIAQTLCRAYGKSMSHSKVRHQSEWTAHEESASWLRAELAKLESVL